MMIVFAISIVIIAFLIPFKKKRELSVGKLIYHKEFETQELNFIIEEVQFQNSIDCIKNYNSIVFQYSNTLSKPVVLIS